MGRYSTMNTFNLGKRLVPIFELFSFESTFSIIHVPSATFSLNHSWASSKWRRFLVMCFASDAYTHAWLSSWIINAMGWIQQPTIIQEDNQTCVYASEAKHMTRNLRHLVLAQLWFKENVADGTCIIEKVDSKENNSDMNSSSGTLPIN